MRLTVACTADPQTSSRFPKRRTSRPLAWRQSLAVTAALLLALVVGAAPVVAHGPNLPRQVA
jgi:hypothetical protein